MAKTCVEVILCLGDRQIQIVRGCTTSREIWDRLKTTYEQSDIASQVAAHRQLMDEHLKENESVINFLENWQSLVDKASIAGLNFSDPQLVSMLLSALPPSWNPFVTTHSSTQNLTLAQLIGKMLQENTMRTTSSHAHSNATSTNLATTSTTLPTPTIAMFVGKYKGKHPLQPQFNQQPLQNKFAICSYCKKPGHLMRQCWKKAYDDREKGNTKAQANHTSFDAQEEGESEVEILEENDEESYDPLTLF